MWKSRELWIGVSINQSLTGTLSHLIVYILLWLLLHWMSELSSYKTTRPAKPTKAIVWSFTEKIGQPQFWRNSVIQDSVIKKGIQQMIPFLMLIWKKRNISKYTKIALPDHECGWFFLFIILWLFFLQCTYITYMFEMFEETYHWSCFKFATLRWIYERQISEGERGRVIKYLISDFWGPLTDQNPRQAQIACTSALTLQNRHWP